jgi:hypothetical protein
MRLAMCPSDQHVRAVHDTVSKQTSYLKSQDRSPLDWVLPTLESENEKMTLPGIN